MKRALILLATLAAATGISAFAAEKSKKPNVIIILADDKYE